MRWDALFGDLEAQLAAADTEALALEVEDGSRLAQGAVSLVQRLRAGLGQPITVGSDGAEPVNGVLAGLGPDWLLVSAGTSEVVVPLAAVSWVGGLGRMADVTAPGRVWSHLDLRSAVRGLARDRTAVGMRVRGAPEVTGTIDRVGADHLDLAVHPLDEPRRSEAVRGVRTVPLAAVLAIRRDR